MFHSFTGNSRKPRQVNLSGHGNAFGRKDTTTLAQKRDPSSSLGGGQGAIALAQAQREQREHQRQRLKAARLFQKVWRGHLSRCRSRDEWRAEWDRNELARISLPGLGVENLYIAIPGLHDRRQDGIIYETAEACHSQMVLLLHFLDVRQDMDRARLGYFGKCLRATWESPHLSFPPIEHTWTLPLYRLSKLTVEALAPSVSKANITLALSEQILSLLIFLAKLIPQDMTRNARRYYSVLASLLSRDNALSRKLPRRVETALLALLTPVIADSSKAYLAFATDFLCKPETLAHVDVNEMVSPTFNFISLAVALNQTLEKDVTIRKVILGNHHRSLWLLAHLVYLQQQLSSIGAFPQISHETAYIKILSTLLVTQGEEIKLCLDVEEEDGVAGDQRSDDLADGALATPLPQFVRKQILSLLHRDYIFGMVSQIKFTDPEQNADSDRVQAIATYALTLSRVLPNRWLTDIRMSLYEASTKVKTASGTSAIVYLWQRSRSTTVFQQIAQDHRKAVPLLKMYLGVDKVAASPAVHGEQREWVTLLFFLELYSFAIKLMDDEEFLAGGRFGATASNSWSARSRGGSLPLEDVRFLVVFLKNLAFALYWKSPDLQGDEDGEMSGDVRGYPEPSTPPFNDGGPEKVTDASQESARRQLRDLVTRVLRSIHQRDARRKFFEDDFWLMGHQDNASSFFTAVVAEEERRQEMSEVDEESEDELEDLETSDDSRPHYESLRNYRRSAPGSARLRRSMNEQKRRRVTRHIEFIGPRLSILRNLPFFVSFDIRVRIFREFVFQDQHRRRGGHVDPDTWRLPRDLGGLGIPRRRRVEIKRDHIFSTAFDQLYGLDEGLKEPIQITFIDRFGAPEAGIDGGGVTKEFLTSIIKEAFDPLSEERLFAANHQNVLYPNPGKLDAHIHLLRMAGMQDGSPEMKAGVQVLLDRYRFLGRIVGKCLYEGVLVDTTLAGYFLLRWALAGSTTQAARQSSYQVTVDDLRDLDEDLYQGVLKLKHYDGDVEADFGLNFTVVDTFEVPVPTAEDPHKVQVKSITRPLKEDGANIPVTNSNRPLYISRLTDHRLRKQALYQTDAFLSGLGEIIQPMWLSMFDRSELQRLVGGDSREIDVADLRANTVYSGLYAMATEDWAGPSPQQEQETRLDNHHQPVEHATIQIFWDVLGRMDDQDRRKVLRFVTSTPRAPLLGFSHLNPRFSIRDSGSRDAQGRLPSTSTCVNLLKLPMYTSAAVMKEKLLYAVNSGAGFDLS